MLKINLQTAYDDFDLYSLTLGQTLPSIYTEAFGLIQACELYLPKRAMSSNGISFLEVLAGANSTHAAFVKQIADRFWFNINAMLSLDSASTTSEDIFQADVRTFNLDRTVDVIAGFYYALGAIHPPGREHALTALKNIRKHLTPGGFFFTTFLENAYNMIVVDQEGGSFNSDESTRVYDIPPYMTAWRKRLGIPFNKDPLELVGTIKETYTRSTGLVAYHYHNFRIQSRYATTVYARFNIRQPIYIRYYAESEIADLAREAGFKSHNIHFLDMDEDGITELDNVLDYSRPDPPEDTPSNAVVMIKTMERFDK